MPNVMSEITTIVRSELKHWWSYSAIKCTPMLFAFYEPDDKTRQALKALECKMDTEEKYQFPIKRLDNMGSLHEASREIERLLERYEGDTVASRDMLMILVPALTSQKGNTSVSLDVNALTQTVYAACDTCPIADVCKEAFTLCTEYVTNALKSLDT